jgi:hypothetical protein
MTSMVLGDSNTSVHNTKCESNQVVAPGCCSFAWLHTCYSPTWLVPACCSRSLLPTCCSFTQLPTCCSTLLLPHTAPPRLYSLALQLHVLVPHLLLPLMATPHLLLSFFLRYLSPPLVVVVPPMADPRLLVATLSLCFPRWYPPPPLPTLFFYK